MYSLPGSQGFRNRRAQLAGGRVAHRRAGGDDGDGRQVTPAELRAVEPRLAAELALEPGVRALALLHHDPIHNVLFVAGLQCWNDNIVSTIREAFVECARR